MRRRHDRHTSRHNRVIPVSSHLVSMWVRISSGSTCNVHRWTRSGAMSDMVYVATDEIYIEMGVSLRCGEQQTHRHRRKKKRTSMITIYQVQYDNPDTILYPHIEYNMVSMYTVHYTSRHPPYSEYHGIHVHHILCFMPPPHVEYHTIYTRSTVWYPHTRYIILTPYVLCYDLVTRRTFWMQFALSCHQNGSERRQILPEGWM